MLDVSFPNNPLKDSYTTTLGEADYVTDLLYEIAMHPYMIQAPALQTKMKTEKSYWRVISSVQKCIRRGDVENAWRSAHAMQAHSPKMAQKLWRRLAVIGFEDIGFGNLHICAATSLLAKSGKARQPYSGTDLLYTIVRIMCESVKSRAACDLANCTADQFQFKKDMFASTPEVWRGVWRDEGLGIGKRISALFLLSGIEVKEGEYTKKRVDILQEELFPLVDHPALRTILRTSLTGEGTQLAITLAVMYAWCENEGTYIIDANLPPTRMSGALPSVAYDMHSRDGGWAIRVLLKRNKLFHNALQNIGVSDVNEFSAFCMILFIVETELLDITVYTETAEDILKLSRVAEMNQLGVGIEHLPTLCLVVESMLEDLHECRDWVVKQPGP